MQPPLVSVVTPVHNGEKYLRECIESVIVQTYDNWEFKIVNNASTDRTLEIAREYAARHPSRISIHSTTELLEIVPNHNLALRQISPGSKYAKMLFADDWMFPECLERMVAVAERYPSIGMVGSYMLEGDRVTCDGLPYPSPFCPGRDVCRGLLLGGPYLFGTPSSLLVRSDLVRARERFYSEDNLHGDLEACFEMLQQSDFGFVHQVLTFSRPRPDSNSVLAAGLASYILGDLTVFTRYGPQCLTGDEFRPRLRQWMKKYYTVLAKNWLRGRDRKFWDLHQNRMRKLGYPLSYRRLAGAVARLLLSSSLHPLDALDGAWKWWSAAAARALRAMERTS